jgi:hypothetical protein
MKTGNWFKVYGGREQIHDTNQSDAGGILNVSDTGT